MRARSYREYMLCCRILELGRRGLAEKISKPDIQPIFIMGAGRSGNTLLARLLHETGGALFGPESLTLDLTYLKYLQVIDSPWEAGWIRFSMVNQEDPWRWDMMDVDAVRVCLMDSDEQTLGNIIHTWYWHYRKEIGYPSDRWGCKTPNPTPFVSCFMKIFPAARIVHVIRNPRDVIASFAKTDIECGNSLVCL